MFIKNLAEMFLILNLTQYQVYAAYEEAVLEYSYLVNVHQAKNVLSDVLGATTGTFDHDGELKSGAFFKLEWGPVLPLKFPRIDFGILKKVV